MLIEFDPDKRDKTLAERGLDFARAAEVFAGVSVTVEDARFDYGETRMTTVSVPMGAWWSWCGRRAARCAASSA